MAFIILILFCITILCSVVFHFSLVISLIIGYFLFLFYGVYSKNNIKALLSSSLEGVLTCKNILITFALIGMMTALWRASGTIAIFIYYAGNLIRPDIFILLSFLFTCTVSFITGTAFGTASTMGVIMMTIGTAMKLNPVMLGGAILSGCYFGDRGSPVSTSALLVATITDTDLYDNVKKMIQTSFIPFIITCIMYLLMGFFTSSNAATNTILNIFQENYTLHILCFLPALLIIVLALLKTDVKLNMSVSIILSIVLCIFIQHIDITSIIKILMTGYQANDRTLAAMMNGGGITSMIKVACVVGISSSYTGLFKMTHILDSIKEILFSLSVSEYTKTLIAAIFLSMISCNQTLTILLTNEICNDLTESKQRAINLENTAVIIAPLVPWSIAGLTVFTTIGAPMTGIIASCYLYVLPLYTLVKNRNHISL